MNWQVDAFCTICVPYSQPESVSCSQEAHKTTTRARGWFLIFLHSSQSVECLSNVYTKKGREFSRDVEMCRNILKYFWIPPFF